MLRGAREVAVKVQRPGIREQVLRDLDTLDEIAGLSGKGGFDRDVVRRVITMVDRAEYKRRQAPPGPKVTSRAFGRDRRLPITNRYRES